MRRLYLKNKKTRLNNDRIRVRKIVKIKGEANIIFLELFYTGQLYPLKLSTILDLGTTLYIFNNLSYFYNFKKALRYKYVIVGSLEVPILGYGDITI